ncbi:Peroxisomal membrane protein PMP27 [Actinomortierella wolfii]|nr:Peroxisomal membrane protein PMP27 [Actinomortierella wolfii]
MLALASPSSTAQHHDLQHRHQPQPPQQRRSRSRTITHSLPRVDTLRLGNGSILSGPNSSPLLSIVNDAKNASSPQAMLHHSWVLATERAKRAAESELSPPISPKNDDSTHQAQEQEGNSTPVHNVSFAKEFSAATTTTTSGQRDIYNEATEAVATVTSARDDNPSPNTPSPLLLSPSAHFSHPDSLSFQLLTAGQHNVGTDQTPANTPTTTNILTSTSPVPATHQYHHHTPKIASVPFATQLEKLTIDNSLEHPRHFIDTPPSSDIVSPTSPSTLAKQDLSCSTSSSPSSPLEAPPSLTPLSQPVPSPSVVTPVKKSISYGKLLRQISNEVDGRDKTIKVIQYFAKLFLWLFLADSKRYKVLAGRVKALAKQFSTTRKVLRLGHFIDPLAAVLLIYKTTMAKVHERGLRRTVLEKPKNETWRDVTRNRLGDFCTILGFVQDIADDLYCLGSIGVLDKVWADKSEPWSIYLWMVGVTIDLHENLQSIYDARQQLKRIACEKGKESPEYEKQARKVHWLQVTTVKLGGDFLFCAYDALHCSFSDGFQAVTGLASGLAGAYKYLGKLIES